MATSLTSSSHGHLGIFKRNPVLTMEQERALEAVERTMSVISIMGCLFIIGSFLFFEAPKKKSFNRLLFFASWGNLLSNVATFIAGAGIRDLKEGRGSATCKIQATLIQWFMPADCLWTFCMAVNVFLTFQTTSIAVNIKKLEKWYFVFCFGVPAVPAFTFLLLDLVRKPKRPYYGDATLWCWIGPGHDTLRLYTFYAPVWVIITITLVLYAITGRAIYKGQVRNHLMRNALNSESDLEPPSPPPKADLVRTVSPHAPRLDVHTHTEISQTFEPVSRWTPETSELYTEGDSVVSPSRTSISSIRQPGHAKFLPIRVAQPSDGSIMTNTPTSHIPSHASAIPISLTAHSSSDHLSNPGVTTTITTMPSTPAHSVHRVTTPPATFYRHSRNRSFESKTNRGAKTYAQVAFLLFMVMLSVWVPSTANRIYGVLHDKHDQKNFALNMAAAIVLPLQGFFNTCIFIFTWRRELGGSLRATWRRLNNKNEIKELETKKPEKKIPWHRPESREELVISIDEDDEKELRYPWHGEPKNASVIAVRVV